MDHSITTGLILITIIFVIFLVCREIVCWYWKINRSIELQEEILRELKKINEKYSASKNL